MKKTIISIVALVALVLAPMSVSAQSASDEATAVGRVTLITPITIANATDLDFGILAASSVAGTAVVDSSASANLTATGGAQVIDESSATAASFNVSGEKNKSFSIVLSDETITLTGATTADELTVALNPQTAKTLDGDGEATFYVGGTLTVPADAEGDVYESEDFTVTVAYN